MPKRMRLPNGFGQITKLKNQRLRKPYRVMITVGKTPEGRPICKLLKPRAYFETYNEAYTALLDYNRNPYDVTSSLTFKEAFDKWFEEYNTGKSASSIKRINLALKCCERCYYLDLRSIRPVHIKDCIDQTQSSGIKRAVKFLFEQILNYGVEYGFVEANIAKSFDPKISREGDKKLSDHTVITADELDALWKRTDDPIVRAILIQCYTGFRPDELCQLRKENVNFERGYIQGGSKTEAGKDRIVPISEKIKGIVKLALDNPTDRLVTTRLNKPLDYRNYYYSFKEVLPNHKPHDPRKTFVSLAKYYKVDEYAIKRIVGHAITDITEKVYTERDLEWLRSEINKIV